MAEEVVGKALRVTQANVNERHIPIAQVADIFPMDAFGGENTASGGVEIEVHLDGVGAFMTDIANSKKILRIRGADVVGKFYSINGVKGGTRLFFEKVGPRAFRVSAIN